MRKVELENELNYFVAAFLIAYLTPLPHLITEFINLQMILSFYSIRKANYKRIQVSRKFHARQIVYKTANKSIQF